MDTYYYDEELAEGNTLVSDWTELLNFDEEPTSKDEDRSLTKKHLAEKKAKEKSRAMASLVQDLMQESSAEEASEDTQALRRALAEKWTDMQSLSQKNVVLLHEIVPRTEEEHARLHQNIVSLVCRSRETSKKHFSAFLISYIKTVTVAGLDGEQAVNTSSPVIFALKKQLLERKMMLYTDNEATKLSDCQSEAVMPRNEKSCKSEVTYSDANPYSSEVTRQTDLDDFM